MQLKSQILTSNNSFKENIKKHLKDIENINKIAKVNSLGGPESSRERHITVSYTHLTLPTILLV